MQHFVAFMYNGQVVLDTTLPLKSQKSCRISSIKPIAVSLSERAQFVVKGFNLPHSTTRLLCALEGKYLSQEACDNVMDGADTTVEHDELQCIRFSYSIPNVTGRGFIEWARRANHVYGQVEIDEVRNEIASYVVKNILKL